MSQFRVGVRLSPKEMAAGISLVCPHGAKNVNFVGGEPTPNLPFIRQSLKYVEVPIPIV
ncbi:hypothetical protein [Thermococcus peptonophilus]|uniref:hypothetical protein n=1 Tax=Thermococcus peptonophilus TaxID=53952 RepID=UPI002F90D852